MKKLLKCAGSLLLALILVVGLLPAAQANPSYEMASASVFVAYPMGGGHPNMKAQTVGTARYTVDYVHYFDCYNGEP